VVGVVVTPAGWCSACRSMWRCGARCLGGVVVLGAVVVLGVTVLIPALPWCSAYRSARRLP